MIVNLATWAVILLVPSYVIVMYARDYCRQAKTRANIEKTLGISLDNDS